MGFVKKTWKDRLVEFPGRRLLKRISGDADSQIVVDVTRNEGTVSQGGDAFSAANMNDLEQRIADEFGSINNNLKGFEPILDSTGKITGYKTALGGADTVFPFSGNYTLKFRLTINTKGYWTGVSQSKSADITAKISDGNCTFSPASVTTDWFLSTENTGGNKYNEIHKYIGYSITLISITKD